MSGRIDRRATSPLRAPPMQRVATVPERFIGTGYPFDVAAFAGGIQLDLPSAVTFFVGENGSGKSMLLEAMAECCGFHPEGGNRDHHRESAADRSPLARSLRLSWNPKVSDGFFLRAESVYNFATYIQEVSNMRAYGGKSLHHQSHGEAFLALFDNRFEHGVYLLDEPEAALSPQRQLAFLKIIHDLASSGQAQFIIATHSPILLAYPGATIYHFGDTGIAPVAYTDTEHYRLTRDFLSAPERYLRRLFGDAPGEATGASE